MRRPRAAGTAHSVQSRLKTKAEATGRPFAELLDLYAVERFLHRLGQSTHRKDFVLKGALLLRHWLRADSRPTRDIDLMGPADLDIERMRAFLGDLFHLRVQDDGLEFAPASLSIQPIREASPVAGFRARFKSYLGRMVIHCQVDVGLGDAVYPPSEEVAPAGILDLPVASIRAYTPYTVVAEKLEALVALGEANSRMKDYYDLTVLAKNLAFDGTTLSEAIRVCFRQRSTEIPEGEPEGLSVSFAEHPLNAGRWAAFTRKAALTGAGAQLSEAVVGIRRFAVSPLQAARDQVAFAKLWPPGGPWQDQGER